MADKKFNIKDQLAGIAALIAAIVAIGGGFSKYGELTQKIKALELASKQLVSASMEKSKPSIFGDNVSDASPVEFNVFFLMGK